ncbi:uncharacterized protein LOC130447124 [Diorhabda sublineata]|uniref:uncharacterized protein LOC130447124 n=1 Tax=Diorhabda sublineata TaxID=1163346 RepID=UPI0024E1603D|nr:uncharacterized protein LOC130447124 [Diorhabda sublineata]
MVPSVTVTESVCVKKPLKRKSTLSKHSSRVREAKKEVVNKINTDILKDVQGEMKEYSSMDTIMDMELSISYPVEFSNSLELSDVPPHKLQFSINVPVILMRNLDAPRLCNGTRLRITNLEQNILGATILTGVGKGESVIIPRIPIIPTDLPSI